MKRAYLFFIFLISSSLSAFSTPITPDTILIGSVKVAIHSSAKPILEREFKMLGANKKYVGTMLEKMKMFFPVIEPVLQQGNIPLDFKYLCVQESALNGNAISTSNAVGYWQFKYETAKDVGLKVNQEIDERRHIIEATKGAVNYFTRNNNVLNNWISTLLSYRLGLGSVKKMSIFSDWNGKNEIQVDSSTDWYVLRFLAYKNFWDEQFALNATGAPSPSLLTYTNFQGKNLLEISDELKISYDDLKRHNPWILKDFIPTDKSYTLYHPSNLNYFTDSEPEQWIVDSPVRSIPKEDPSTFVLTASIDTTKLYPTNKAIYPKRKGKDILSNQTEIKIHKVEAGDNLSAIAQKYGMSLNGLLELNNLSMTSLLSIGQPIKYLRRIPMIELISQKLDEKARNAKPGKEELVEEVSQKPIEKEENNSERKIVTKNEKESFLIEPAETREINVLPEKPEKELWKDTKLPEKTPEQNIPIPTEFKEKETPKVITLPAEHVVLQGETLYGIAKKYGMKVSDLLKLNKSLVKSGLQTGQTLKLK